MQKKGARDRESKTTGAACGNREPNRQLTLFLRFTGQRLKTQIGAFIKIRKRRVEVTVPP